MQKHRAVCLNCMDGRIQEPVIGWIKENYPVDYVDMLTEPGMDGLLADRTRDIEDIVSKVRLSTRLNQAELIFVVGHYDCRGNPVSEDVHHEQIGAAVERMHEIFPCRHVIGLWINANWQGEACCACSAVTQK